MGVGALVAFTLPGLVILLVVLAVAEHVWSRLGRRSPLHGRSRHALTAGRHGRLAGGVAYIDRR